MVAGRGRGRGRGRGGRNNQRGTHSTTPLEEPLHTSQPISSTQPRPTSIPTPQSTSSTQPQPTPIPTPQSTSSTQPQPTHVPTPQSTSPALLQSTPLTTPQSGPLSTPSPSSSNGITSRHGSSSLQITENGSSIRKLMIRPRGDELLPCRVTTRRIGMIIKTKYDEPWSNWSQVPEDVKKMWFEQFEKSFKWDDHDQDDVWRLFRRKGSDLLRTSLADIRRKKSDGKWLSKNVLKALKEKWDKDEKFKKISALNKKNIALNKDGRVNRSGAISISEHRRRLEKELGREVSVPELFEKLNYDKDKGKWKAAVPEKTYDTYKKLQESKTSQGEEVDDDSMLFLEANGGKNKRGRAYGFGSEASMYDTPGASSSNSCTRPYKKNSSDVDELKTRLGAMEITLQKVLGIFEKMAGAPNSSSSNNFSSSINNVMNSIRKDIGVEDDFYANDDDDEYIDEDEVDGEEGGNDGSGGNEDMD